MALGALVLLGLAKVTGVAVIAKVVKQKKRLKNLKEEQAEQTCKHKKSFGNVQPFFGKDTYQKHLLRKH